MSPHVNWWDILEHSQCLPELSRGQPKVLLNLSEFKDFTSATTEAPVFLIAYYLVSYKAFVSCRVTLLFAGPGCVCIEQCPASKVSRDCHTKNSCWSCPEPPPHRPGRTFFHSLSSCSALSVPAHLWGKRKKDYSLPLIKSIKKIAYYWSGNLPFRVLQASDD